MKQLFSLFSLFLLLASVPAVADSDSGRRRVDAGWEFVRQDMANAWEVFRPVKAGKPESVPLWQPVSLPHCWNAEDAVDPDVNYYQGPGWYRKCLEIANPYPGGRTVLEFEGAGQRAQVYVYTQRVGSHVGGYDRWQVDITEAVAQFRASKDAGRFGGKVPVAVRCDNSRDVERIPSSMSDFNVYGGLYRHVNLLYRPSVAIDEIHLEALLEAKRMEVNLHFTAPCNSFPKAAVTLRLIDPVGKVVYRSAMAVEQAEMKVSIPVKQPKVWDVDSPQLYTLEAALQVGGDVQTCSTKAGFRTWEFQAHGPFFLNGRRLLLNGTHRHEDHAGVGAAMTDGQIRREMQQIKDMGANFVRLGHYQQSDLVLELCDSLGLLVWEEIPWCRGGLGGKEYRAQAERMLANMIRQHRNHPSIILWGLGNENDWPGDFPVFDRDSIHAFMAHLHATARRLDASRQTVIRRCDFCSDITEVYSPSIWAGWYSGTMKDYRRMTEEAIRRYPHFLHAEWGGDSHVGRHTERTDLETVNAADKHGDWSETYMVRLFDWTLKEQQSMPRLTGAAFWTFKDFSTPLRPDNPIPYVNQKGVVERDGTPKESYYVFQAYWSRKPMVHIYGHSMPVRWGKAGERKEMLVYSNCRAVELFVNGRSQGLRRRNVEDYPATGFHWDVVLQEGRNEIKAVADGGLSDTLSQTYQTAAWGAPHHVELSAVPQADGTVLMEARIVDIRNVQCLDAAHFVRFDITGAADLLQHQGTSTGSRKIQASNGRANIRIMPRKGGRAAVSVQVNGLPVALWSTACLASTSDL